MFFSETSVELTLIAVFPYFLNCCVWFSLTRIESEFCSSEMLGIGSRENMEFRWEFSAVFLTLWVRAEPLSSL